MAKVTLSKPIFAHGAEVGELVFREPTGEDIVACGYPLQMGDGVATPVAGAIARYISRLGGVPPSAVKQMSGTDFNACMAALLPLFGE